MLFCTNCGNPLSAGDRVCGKCGCPVQMGQGNENSTQNFQNPPPNANMQYFVSPQNMSGGGGRWTPKAVAGLVIGGVFAVGMVIVAIILVLKFTTSDGGNQAGKDPDNVVSVQNSEKQDVGKKQTAETEKLVDAAETPATAEKPQNETEAPTNTPAKDLQKANLDIVQIDTSEYPKVHLYFSVSDLNGKYIRGITPDQIELSEKSANSWVQQTGTFVGREGVQQKSVSLVMDVSGSMENALDAECEAARVLLENMKKDGRYQAALTVFSDYFQEMSGFTTDLDVINERLDTLEPGGSTALYDTLVNSLYKTVSQQGQKYILAFTDGADNAYSTTKEEVIKLAREYKIPIYIIYLSGDVDDEFEQDIAGIARESGGKTFKIDQIGELENMYDQIFTMQDNLYSYTYTTRAKDWNNVRLSYRSNVCQGEAEEEYMAHEIQTEWINNGLISRITADSVLAPQSDSRGHYDYEPENMIDGDYNTAWAEGASGNGIGTCISITLDGTHRINGIEIANGYKKRIDLYKKNSRLKKVRFTFSDGSVQEAALDDVFSGVSRIDFGSGVDTSSIKMEILDVYPGNKYKDTCITEINLY